MKIGGNLGPTTEKALRIMLPAIFIAAAVASGEAHPFTLDAASMPGFRVLTAEDGAMDTREMVVIEFEGPIAPPMAENLRAIWQEIRKDSRFEQVVLRLNSPGGTDIEGQEVIEVLSEIREHIELTTLVGENDLCASMCIGLFIQGETRYASPASSWMFHGASRGIGNVPSLSLTMQYFDLFKQRNIDEKFIDYLFEEHYVTSPGAYWLSGSELAQKSNIITNLAPNWRPSAVSSGPQDGGIILGGI